MWVGVWAGAVPLQAIYQWVGRASAWLPPPHGVAVVLECLWVFCSDMPRVWSSWSSASHHTRWFT